MTEKFKIRLYEYQWFVRDRSVFILLNSKLNIFNVKHPSECLNDIIGVSAEEAMFQFESFGKRVPCLNNTEFLWLLAGKSLRDWHIEEWSNGIKYGYLHINDLIKDHYPKTLVETVKQAYYTKQLVSLLWVEQTWEFIKRNKG